MRGPLGDWTAAVAALRTPQGDLLKKVSGKPYRGRTLRAVRPSFGTPSHRVVLVRRVSRKKWDPNLESRRAVLVSFYWGADGLTSTLVAVNVPLGENAPRTVTMSPSLALTGCDVFTSTEPCGDSVCTTNVRDCIL